MPREQGRPAARELAPWRDHREASGRQRVVRYRTIQELPKEHTDQYDGHQKEAFLKAFNGAYQKYHHHEARALEAAHMAAIKAGQAAEGTPPTPLTSP